MLQQAQEHNRRSEILQQMEEGLEAEERDAQSFDQSINKKIKAQSVTESISLLFPMLRKESAFRMPVIEQKIYDVAKGAKQEEISEALRSQINNLRFLDETTLIKLDGLENISESIKKDIQETIERIQADEVFWKYQQPGF
ncbi:hypothetical protein HON22_02435 [Candidatus Peregrinibacteria bacterium]|jgi:hypothetical protein|nr:hypothetical protein [Candidatus Peregrinibacteria bacterium]